MGLTINGPETILPITSIETNMSFEDETAFQDIDWSKGIYQFYTTYEGAETAYDKVPLDIDTMFHKPSVTTQRKNSKGQIPVWYWDKQYTSPCEQGQIIHDFVTNGMANGHTISFYVYGRWEYPVQKVLDINGVKVLYDLLSLKDYPNNDVLKAVIEAIDETKLDKEQIFVGTQEEYNTRVDSIPLGAIVIITDE